MQINSFKEGDLITRCAPVEYGHNQHKDGSYMGDKCCFIGVDDHSKIIVLKLLDSHLDGPITLSYGRDAWDKGWAYWPEELVNKAAATK